MFSKTLEVGVDGIVIEPKDASVIKEFADLTLGREAEDRAHGSKGHAHHSSERRGPGLP